MAPVGSVIGKRKFMAQANVLFLPILGKKQLSVKTSSIKLEKPSENDFENSKKGHFWAHFGPCSLILVEEEFLSKIEIHHNFTIIASINCAKLQKNLINNFREKPKTVTDGAKDGRVSSHLSQHLLV